MNIVNKLEEMLANRRWHVEGRDERLAFDALPALLAVARAAKACGVECQREYTRNGIECACGECDHCFLLAALEDLSDLGAQLAVEAQTNILADLTAAPTGRCSLCGRACGRTSHGTLCGMTQPDGSRCQGRFVAVLR